MRPARREYFRAHAGRLEHGLSRSRSSSQQRADRRANRANKSRLGWFFMRPARPPPISNVLVCASSMAKAQLSTGAIKLLPCS